MLFTTAWPRVGSLEPATVGAAVGPAVGVAAVSWPPPLHAASRASTPANASTIAGRPNFGLFFNLLIIPYSPPLFRRATGALSAGSVLVAPRERIASQSSTSSITTVRPVVITPAVQPDCP